MKKKRWAATPFFGLFFCPVFTFILMECYTHNPFTTMNKQAWALNLVFYWLLAAFFLALFGRIRTALMAETGFFAFVGLANYYVLSFRSSPILPWDIYSYRTAASVADNFSYALPGKVWLVLLGFACILLAEWLFGKYCCNRFFTEAGIFGNLQNGGLKKAGFGSRKTYSNRKTHSGKNTAGSRNIHKNWIVRIATGIVSLVFIIGLTTLLHQDTFVSRMKLYDKLFTPDVMQKRDGTAVAFLMELKYLFVEKPQGYDKKAAADMLASYEEAAQPEGGNTGAEIGSAGDGSAVRSPNIIVIMNEAFSDMGVIGEFSCNEDYMPFFHSLKEGAENTITGNLHVSVLGGNTANTEFEFLTGNTMAFLPEGSIPYQQYMTGPVPALPKQLQDMGYHTVAMHPYRAKGWNRDKVYEWMGFEEQVFKDGYENPEYIRKYVSDKSCYDKIIEAYEEKPSGTPLFVFNVTMQNHGGYSQDYDNFIPQITPEGFKSGLLSKYLSLIRISDEAFEELVTYFAGAEEDTVIVFFGDHQPSDSIAMPIWKSKGLLKEDLPEEEIHLRYQVPFAIWANFDIKEAKDVETSCNYLAGKTLQAAGLPLNSYQSYLMELEKEWPVITARQAVEKNAVPEAGSEKKEEDTKGTEMLEAYRKLQYFQMFDAGKEAEK